MEHTVTIRNTDDLDRAAGEFLNQIGKHRLMAFYAPMGAGKTTFTTALCKHLGVTDPVCSPTFTIINEYVSADGESIYHFDFYRITKNSEAIDIGLDDYLYSGCLCLMEWPENIEDLLPDETLRVHINNGCSQRPHHSPSKTTGSSVTDVTIPLNIRLSTLPSFQSMARPPLVEVIPTFIPRLVQHSAAPVIVV